jgi:hypothetical protein
MMVVVVLAVVHLVAVVEEAVAVVVEVGFLVLVK